MNRRSKADVKQAAEVIGKALGLPNVTVRAGSSSYARPWQFEFRREGEEYPYLPVMTLTTTGAYSANQAVHYLTAYMGGVAAGREAERGWL